MQSTKQILQRFLITVLLAVSFLFISCASSQKRDLHETAYEKVERNLTVPVTQEVPSDPSKVKIMTVKTIQFHLDFTDLGDISYYIIKNPDSKQNTFVTTLVGKGQIEVKDELNKEKRRKSKQLFIQLNVVSSNTAEDALYTALVKSCVDLASQIQNTKDEKKAMDLVLSGEMEVDFMSDSFQFTVSEPKIKDVNCSAGKS